MLKASVSGQLLGSWVLPSSLVFKAASFISATAHCTQAQANLRSLHGNTGICLKGGAHSTLSVALELTCCVVIMNY